MLYGSLCSGIGGLDLAVESVFDATPAWFCEADEHAASVLRRWWPDVPVLPDLKTQDWTQVERVELITAGYPCQPFSFAGRRAGTDDPRHLWPHVIDAVRVLRPRIVVLENVAGHLGLGFDAVLGDLAEAGFDAEWAVVRASDAGACHRRERLFVVAHARCGQLQRRRIARDVGSTPSGATGQAPQRQRDGNAALDRCADAPDANRGRLEERSEQDSRTEQPGLGAPRRADADGRGSSAADTHGEGLEGREPTQGRVVPSWGDYEPAIRRWERALGRRAPEPLDEKARLSVPFVEWMQGFDPGWVDGLSRTAALRCLGNSVVQQQGVLALTVLSGETTTVKHGLLGPAGDAGHGSITSDAASGSTPS